MLHLRTAQGLEDLAFAIESEAMSAVTVTPSERQCDLLWGHSLGLRRRDPRLTVEEVLDGWEAMITW